MTSFLFFVLFFAAGTAVLIAGFLAVGWVVTRFENWWVRRLGNPGELVWWDRGESRHDRGRVR